MSARIIIVTLILSIFSAVAVIGAGSATSVQREPVFVKGEVDSAGFADPGLDETAKHIRERLRIVSAFAAAKSEADAGLLVVVNKRSELHGEKTITVSVSIKNGTEWVPGVKITETCKCAWTLTAEEIIRSMAKWNRDRKKG